MLGQGEPDGPPRAHVQHAGQKQLASSVAISVMNTATLGGGIGTISLRVAALCCREGGGWRSVVL
jgi:hypothetical protein